MINPKRMEKKGQVTVFLIMGIVIMAIFAGVFFIVSKVTEEQLEIEEARVQEGGLSTNAIQLFIEKCLEKTSQEQLLVIGTQGGYYELNDKILDGFFINLIPYITEENEPISMSIIFSPYYFRQGAANLPEIEVIERELAKGIEKELPKCLDNFTVFKNQGYNFKSGKIQVDPFIGSKLVIINLKYPLEIKRENKINSLDRFMTKLNFNFKEKYELAQEILEEQKRDPAALPLGFLTNLAYENNFTYELVDYIEPVVQFNLIFNDTLLDMPFIYSFMFWYDRMKSPEEYLGFSEEQNTIFYDEQSLNLLASNGGPEPTEFPEDYNWEDLRKDYGIDIGESGDISQVQIVGDQAMITGGKATLTTKEDKIEELDIQSGSEVDAATNKFSGTITSTTGQANLMLLDDLGIEMKITLNQGSSIEIKDGKIVKATKFIPQHKITLMAGETDKKGTDIESNFEMNYNSETKIIEATKEITINNKQIKSENNLEIKLEKGKYKVTGKEVEVFYSDYYETIGGDLRKFPTSNNQIKFSGEITIYDDFEKIGPHLDFGKNTKIVLYNEKGRSVKFRTTKEIEYYSKDLCAVAKKSCVAKSLPVAGIPDYPSNLKIIAKEDIHLLVDVYDESIKLYDVPLIEDKSIIYLKYQKKADFLMSRFFVKGPQPGKVSEFGGVLNTYFQNEETGLICGQSYGGGGSQSCMSPIEYKGMQLTQNFEERNRALLKIRGEGAFYGSNWGGVKNFEKKLEQGYLQDEDTPKVIDCIGYGTQVLSQAMKEAAALDEYRQKPTAGFDEELYAEPYAIDPIATDDPYAYLYADQSEGNYLTEGEKVTADFLELVEKNNNKGTFIFKEMVEKEGWEAAYWNAQDPRKFPENLMRYKQSVENDNTLSPTQKANKLENLEKNERLIRSSLNNRENPTYGIGDSAVPLKDQFVNINNNQGQEDLTAIRNIPFGLVCIDQGYHCGVLSKGNIYEVHWNKGPRDKKLFEITPVTKWEQSGVLLTTPGAIEEARMIAAREEALAKAERSSSEGSIRQ